MENKELEKLLYNGSLQETIFFLGIMISREYKLEKEFLVIDNYYDCILELVKDYAEKGYGHINEGLLESMNRYLNDNEVLISNRLAKFQVID